MVVRRESLASTTIPPPERTSSPAGARRLELDILDPSAEAFQRGHHLLLLAGRQVLKNDRRPAPRHIRATGQHSVARQHSADELIPLPVVGKLSEPGMPSLTHRTPLRH